MWSKKYLILEEILINTYWYLLRKGNPFRFPVILYTKYFISLETFFSSFLSSFIFLLFSLFQLFISSILKFFNNFFDLQAFWFVFLCIPTYWCTLYAFWTKSFGYKELNVADSSHMTLRIIVVFLSALFIIDSSFTHLH